MTTSLVAITHELSEGSNDRLMNDVCAARFKERVMPRITNRSLILCEGFNHDALVGPKHPKYDFTRNFLFGDALGSITPTFGGFDPRHTPSAEESNMIAAMYDEWQSTVMRIIRLDTSTIRIPVGVGEVVEAIRRGGPSVELDRRPTQRQVALAAAIRDTNKMFDRRYLDAIRAYSRKFDTCLFVGGASHVVSMALKRAYPIIDLTSPEDAQSIFFTCLSDRWVRHP